MTKYVYSTDSPRSLVTSVRVELSQSHATLTIWTRGGNSGELIVRAGDATLMVARLLGVTIDKLPAPELVS